MEDLDSVAELEEEEEDLAVEVVVEAVEAVANYTLHNCNKKINETF